MIRSLAYLGFISPQANDWNTFGPDVLGAQIAPTAADEAVRLRIDEAAWRLAIHTGDRDDLAYIGWDAGDEADLAAAIEQLRSAGVEVTEADEDFAATRSVQALAWFTDPFGFRHELISGQHLADDAFVPGREMQGAFVTGEGGMGHLVLMVPDLEQASDFYMGVLGFQHSDDVEVGIKVRFVHCNPRHHTLAFSMVPGHVGVHHLMLEVDNANDVGRAYDIVNDAALPVAMTLGRHTNDEMFSFYVRTPSGFEIEYGAEGRLIDTSQPYEPEVFDSISMWGHKPPSDPLMPAILRRV